MRKMTDEEKSVIVRAVILYICIPALMVMGGIYIIYLAKTGQLYDKP